MPLNQTKKYNQFLDIEHMNERERNTSLRSVFDRDIVNNIQFLFRGKKINPNKLDDDDISLNVLFTHLTCDVPDQATKSREFDIHRSRRLHWVKHHIEEKCSEHCKIFSCIDRNQANKRDEERTYIYNEAESYVVVLRPYRDETGYYLLTAHYVDGRDPEKLKKKYKRRLDRIL